MNGAVDPGPWTVGQLGLDAYLRRIAYTGPVEPGAASPEGVYRAHLAAIRFENLGIFLDGGVRADLESVPLSSPPRSPASSPSG
jgi:N-hydroxyarylamine O-acetyltransferase